MLLQVWQETYLFVIRNEIKYRITSYNVCYTKLLRIGLVQLEKLDGFNAARQKNAAMLSAGLKDISGVVPAVAKTGCTHVFHQYTIRAEKREELAAFLKEKEIGTGIHYPIPIHKQPYYMELRNNFV